MTEISSEILDLIDKLSKAKENFIDYQTEDTLQFQRTVYGDGSAEGRYGSFKHSTWKILLDESKTKWCVRTKTSFKSIDKRVEDEVVTAPSNVKKLLLSKNKQDNIVATTILDQIADKKYGRTTE